MIGGDLVFGVGIRSDKYPDWVYLAGMDNGTYMNTKTGQLAWEVDRYGPPEENNGRLSCK